MFAFVAPKIIGGRNAPSPVGELGMVEMSQALDLSDVCYEQVNGDPLYFCFLLFPPVAEYESLYSWFQNFHTVFCNI